MKANIKYADGTVVELEGTPEEIKQFVWPASPNWWVNAPGIAVQPYKVQELVFIPTIWTEPLTACQHEYESPWYGLNPPPCKKCGVALPNYDTWTVTNSSHQEAANR